MPTSVPPWYFYALLAALAGGGGGFLGAYSDPIRTDPTARPDPYTGTMAKNDLSARDARLTQLERRVEGLESRCERTVERVVKCEGMLWLLEDQERQRREGGHPHYQLPASPPPPKGQDGQ